MKIILRDILAITMNKRNDIIKCSIIIKDKRIEKITTKTDHNFKADKIIEGKGMICIPALINGHIHSDVTLARGLCDGLTLYQQDYNSYVSRKNWFREELKGEASNISRLLLYCELIKGGTGFLCDVPFWPNRENYLPPLLKSKLTGAIAIDYRTDFINGKQLEEEKLIEKLNWISTNGFIPLLSGPSEEHYEPNLFRMLMRISEKVGCFIHLHLSETEYRVKIIKEKYGLTPVQYLDKKGVLNNRLIASHCVHLSENDIELMIEKGVRIVSCPTAEMKISDGIAPMVNFLDNNYYIGLGTDGALWNDSSDMFQEAKNLLLSQRVKHGANRIMPIHSLSAATIWGARVFSKENEIGSIEEGKNASIAILNPNKPHCLPIYHGKTSNILQNITTCMNAQDVESLIVNGNILMEKRRITTLNEETILEKAKSAGLQLFSNLELENYYKN